MVGYELSKRGWIIFFPPYDERVDILAMKTRCSSCKSPWDMEHVVACLNPGCREFEVPITGINSKNTYKNKRCASCGHIVPREKGNSYLSVCPECGGVLQEAALCPGCDSEIGVKKAKCSRYPECKSESYELVYRSIQVKSSHLVDGGRNIAFNFKYQDLVDDPSHFLVVYNRQIMDGVERHFYYVLSIDDFMSIKNTETVSYQIYQNDRGHYSLSSLEPFLYKEEDSHKAVEMLERAQESGDYRTAEELRSQLATIDVFRKLD